MNSMKLKHKLKCISENKKINFNIVLRNYMYERFIERLSKSKYKDNFILKGGYFLSIILGIDNRHTMDIDFSFKNITLSSYNILKIINEIISINVNDDAKLEIIEIDDIKDKDEYSGYRIKLMVSIENVKEVFNIDIATGDIVTPKEIVFNYTTMIDYKLIDLKSYNLETVLSEKIETILSKKEFNSRLKDYYDVYMICNVLKNKIDNRVLESAIKITFKNRNLNVDVEKTIVLLKNSKIMIKRWNSYKSYNKHASHIEYGEIINCIENIILTANLINV